MIAELPSGILTPLIPVINRIARWIPIYKLIWREHYQAQQARPHPT
jgi:hypothetical protein